MTEGAIKERVEVARILVVDDDEAFRNLVRLRLEDTYEIIDTGRAEDALALALEHKPGAVLLDLSMPALSGFELCQTLASLSYTRTIPILVISGAPAAKYKAFCQNLGAVEYLEKPVDFDELRARLAVALKTRQPERRAEASVRLRVILKLVGTDVHGKKFELLTTTDSVSASGFLCSCTAALRKDSVVEVFLVAGEERSVGRARAVSAEWLDTPLPRYGFRFLEKPSQWILQ